METRYLDAAQVHYVWDSSLAPRLEVPDGAVVVVETRDSSDGHFTRQSGHDSVSLRVFSGHPLSGPIYVTGALPGMSLDVQMLDVAVADWGFTWVAPGYGLLGSDVRHPHLKIWEVVDGYAWFSPSIRIRAAPFLGIIGVAPSEPGTHSTVPPRRTGGNLDVRQLVAGSTIRLPIECNGALLSLGDGHAAQGDGEVGISAIETSCTATIRLSLSEMRDAGGGPSAHIPLVDPLVDDRGARGYFAAMGVGPDLLECARDATRGIVGYLMAEHGLLFEESLCLASAVMDLRISEAVDLPNHVVTALLPLEIFTEG